MIELPFDQRPQQPSNMSQHGACGFWHRYTIGNEDESEVVTAHHDYLMLACKLDDVDWLDVRSDEKAIFGDIQNYELTTTLVSIPANDHNTIPTTPHMFLAGKLVSADDLNR